MSCQSIIIVINKSVIMKKVKKNQRDSQPRDNKNQEFLLFKYFLNNLLFTVFMQNTISKLNNSLLEKTWARFCAAVY